MWNYMPVEMHRLRISLAKPWSDNQISAFNIYIKYTPTWRRVVSMRLLHLMYTLDVGHFPNQCPELPTSCT